MMMMMMMIPVAKTSPHTYSGYRGYFILKIHSGENQLNLRQLVNFV